MKWRQCQYCIYFVKSTRVIGLTSAGHCHRYPPQYGQSNQGFPETKINDWCGEFKDRTDEQ